MDLQHVSDRLEIADVLIRYTRAIDTGDWDRLDRVFTPDAAIDYTQSGGSAGSYAEIKPWLAEMLPTFPKRMHTLGQIDISYDAGGDPGFDTGFDTGLDEADVAAYFHNPMMLPSGDGQETLVEFGGIYEHRMVRTVEGWRSRRLHETIVWKRGL